MLVVPMSLNRVAGDTREGGCKHVKCPLLPQDFRPEALDTGWPQAENVELARASLQGVGYSLGTAHHRRTQMVFLQPWTPRAPDPVVVEL